MKLGRSLCGAAIAFALLCSIAQAIPTVRLEGPSSPLQAGGGSFDVNIYVSGFDRGPSIIDPETGQTTGYEWDNRLSYWTVELEFAEGAPATFVLGHEPGGYGFRDDNFETYETGRKVTLGPETPADPFPLVGSYESNGFGAEWLPYPLVTSEEILMATATFEYDEEAIGLYSISFDPEARNVFLRHNVTDSSIDYQVIGGTVQIVPEPATVIVLSGGLFALVMLRRKR